MRNLAVALLSMGLAAVASAHQYTSGALKIDHPWSRETASKATVGAGFLSITNTGETADRLVAIKSDVAKNVEIHTMTLQGGVMQMRQLTQGIALPPGTTATLAPGADHIMFMGLKSPIKQTQDFKAILVFEKASEVEVTFKVEAQGAVPPPTHQH